MKKFIIFLITLLILSAGGVGVYYYMNKKPNNKITPEKKPDNPKVNNDVNFNVNIIKTVNSSYTSNYLISPYSIEIALNMLKAGAHGTTLEEIESVVGTRNINKVSKDVKIANAMFVKNEYQKDIKDDYYSLIKTNYNAEVLYDDFNTPDVINNWVNEKTDKMIPKIMDDISSDFVLGLANAIAIDVSWSNPFECNNTTSEEFTKFDGTKYNVEMMHNTYDNSDDYKYFETDDAKGVILPYKSDDSSLEFVGILPNDDVAVFIESLTEDKLNKIDETVKTENDTKLKLSLPRFKYSFSLDNFIEILQTMGINEMFTVTADFQNISDSIALQVSEAIHKTHIDLNEKGTKAAAVTFFGLDKALAPLEEKTIELKFNKPFAYMIRDSKTKEILFFGVTYEPNLWEQTTCEELEN